MALWKVRIRGTINDEVEVEADDDATEDQVRKLALDQWRYVEFEDLEARDAQQVSD